MRHHLVSRCRDTKNATGETMMEEQKGDRHFEIYAQTALEQNHLDRAITTATAISNYIQEMNKDVDALLANNAGDAGAARLTSISTSASSSSSWDASGPTVSARSISSASAVSTTKIPTSSG